VTVKLPRALKERLEEEVSRGSYLDLSEEIRSILRARFMEWQRDKLPEFWLGGETSKGGRGQGSPREERGGAQ